MTIRTFSWIVLAFVAAAIVGSAFIMRAHGGPIVSPGIMQQFLASQGYSVGTVKCLDLPRQGRANVAIAGLKFSAKGDWIVVEILPRLAAMQRC